MQIMDERWKVRGAKKLAKELGNERGREAKALEKARKLAHREAMNDLKKSIWQLKPGNVYGQGFGTCPWPSARCL